MGALLNELNRIIMELGSDKPPTRHKAIEQLDQKLNNSKIEIIALLRCKNSELTWQSVFLAATDATVQHAVSLKEATEKTYKTLQNKTYLYDIVVGKIIDYNLEAGSQNHFLSKASIFNAFEEGIKQRCVVKHFGLSFLNMLDRGIYSSPTYVCELKVSEYSRILSYLFELNVDGDELLRTKILKSITKTVQLAKERVQLHTDLVDYLPELNSYIMAANTTERKVEVVRLYFLFVSELSVNYHQKLCAHMQQILPKLCEFYNENCFRDDIKQIFFQSVLMSLRTFYPKVSASDFNTFQVPVNESWPQTMLKLRTIVDMEIRSNSLPRYMSSQLSNNKFSEHFVQMSALVVYIVLWHLEMNKNSNGDDVRHKMPRPADQLEVIFKLIDKQESKFNEMWFSIFTELVQLSDSLINVANFQQTLETTYDVLRMFGNAKNLRNVRLCLLCLLRKDQELRSSNSISEHFLAELWLELGNYLISETTSTAEIILEKQLILQALIRHGKITPTQCSTLLQYIRSNEMLKRNECIATIRELFIHAVPCGIDKVSAEMEPIINWAYGTCDKNSAAKLIHNIAAIDPKLLADTFAIGIINFLDEQQLAKLSTTTTTIEKKLLLTDAADLQLLNYKYNRKFICLAAEQPFSLHLAPKAKAKCEAESIAKNGLFQNNYELLMRVLNYETTKNYQTTDILKDLRALHKLCCTIERLLHYKVFDVDNFGQCPIIKRIGLFLSHLEFQLKSNNASDIVDDDLRSILQLLQTVLEIFTSNEILLRYLENQPLEELITFVAAALSYSIRKSRAENVDQLNLSTPCFRILGTLCASSSHSDDAFAHISTCKLNWQAKDVLVVTKMLCNCRTVSGAANAWLVNKLKGVFQYHYMDLDIVNELIEYMPTIFSFVYDNEDLLENMLIALISLLKVALKKSYSAVVTGKILRCVSLIAQRCDNIFAVDNFAVICKSAVKFLALPSLEIQFATLSTLTALMNINCVSNDPIAAGERHLQFCEELYDSIDWKKLPFDNEDLKQNNISVAIQTLTSFITFSSYHQEIALKNLIYFCALLKLNEADFIAYQSVVGCYDLSIRELVAPYVDVLIHEWISKKYPISKFPYFLCYTSKDAFLRGNAKTIMVYLFLYGNLDDLKRIRKLLSERDIVQETLPLIAAFKLPQSSACPEAEYADYVQRIRALTDCLTHFKIDASKSNAAIDDITLYNTIKLLFDKAEMRRLLGFGNCNRKPEWFNLGSESLIKCLHSYIVGGSNTNRETEVLRIQAISELMAKHPLVLVKLLATLKTNCYDAVFPMHQLLCFFLYCTVAELILDGAPEKAANFFIRDIWHFLPGLILHTHSCQLQKAALEFWNLVLRKPRFCLDNLDEIAKQLLGCIIHIEGDELKSQAVATLKKVIELYREQIDVTALLEDVEANEILEPLRQLVDRTREKRQPDSIETYIKAFLENGRVEGLRSLRQYISRHKDRLQEHENLLFCLINRLMKVVRDSTKVEFSLDAMKCLAEIGPLKMTHISYYFQTDFDAIKEHGNTVEPMQQFVTVICGCLERYLIRFDPRTQEALITVARHVVNSKSGAQLMDQHPNLQVFRVKTNYSSFLNAYATVPSIDWLAALQSTESLDYEQWICSFMAKVFKSCEWHGFDEFAAKAFAFAEVCLQPFIKLLLANKEQHLEQLTTMLDYFFGKSCDGSKGIFQEKRAIRQFLNMCECIRVVNNWTIPLNLSNVIMASNHCQAYFLSILYLELWGCESASNNNVNILTDESFQLSAKTAYESIGCTEAISGFLNPLRSRVDYLSLSNNWSDILLESDGVGQPNSQLCTDILKRNGMLSFASLQQRSSKAVDYEICWRLGHWSEPTEGHLKVNTLAVNMEEEYKKHHFVALKSIRNREEENSLSAIANAYQCVLAILRDISVECLQSVYKYLSWLSTLQQAEDFCQIQFANRNAADDIFKKWQTELDLKYGNFDCKEYILSHQISLFKTVGTRAGRRIQQFYKESPTDSYLLKCIRECKTAGKLNLAKKYIVELREMPAIKESTQISVLLEDADVHSKTGNQQLTKAILQHIVTNKNFIYCPQRITALCMQGEFLINSNAESFTNILQGNFNAALKLLDDFESRKGTLMDKYPDLFKWDTFEAFISDNRKSAYRAVAKYADRGYRQLNEYRNSEDYKTLQNIIKLNRQMADTVTDRSDRDKRVGAICMKRFANLDEKELAKVEEDLNEHLCTAVSNYIAYCTLDESFSSSTIYRIIALWFANKENAALHDKIKMLIKSVPSYKFICALTQLVAHLSSKNPEFLKVLVELLVRCAQDHPHHAFYQLYALVYASSDSANSSSERAVIAKRIIAKAAVAKDNGSCSKQLDTMFPALIEFANAELGNTGKVPISDKMKRLRNINAAHCPTMELAVSPNKHYTITSVVEWAKEATLVGGINAPKKLMCLCSDGVTRPQLLKGKDDLRQDAVMQQVFGLFNELLNNEAEFIERKLQLRTYRITPLSMRSGILEWCPNTVPIGHYLIAEGNGGAHKRYRPQDWNNKKCRKMAETHIKSSYEKRLEAYNMICANIKPVFHYFLLEKFLIPGVWFERRLAYTNSVATTSMVGFVLGLGDRHTQNILIDETTAEVVHIDFGIAFEQGKVQMTPEAVPFRLTRDIVAPMGICGTNGVFTKSCEATMHTLRRYKTVITTVLEVLLHDPLYIWNVVPSESPSQMHELSNESTNLTAQRALLIVQNKLEGRTGLLGTSNVEVQVQRLINEATLPSNLSKLYYGWDAHL